MPKLGQRNFTGFCGLRLLFAFVVFIGIGASLEIILSPLFFIDRWFITPTMPLYAGYLYVAEFARYPLSLVALGATAYIWAVIGSNNGQLVTWLRERALFVVFVLAAIWSIGIFQFVMVTAAEDGVYPQTALHALITAIIGGVVLIATWGAWNSASKNFRLATLPQEERATPSPKYGELTGWLRSAIPTSAFLALGLVVELLLITADQATYASISDEVSPAFELNRAIAISPFLMAVNTVVVPLGMLGVVIALLTASAALSGKGKVAALLRVRESPKRSIAALAVALGLAALQFLVSASVGFMFTYDLPRVMFIVSHVIVWVGVALVSVQWRKRRESSRRNRSGMEPAAPHYEN
ncbi:hypothetical protein C8A06_1276 [Microbacteriaceae bacterium MWH-Ta3]|nr:hypothetical protein C8A06_1276 [Microbacteriaceae bacterium MWH-Ta3]